MPTPPTRPPTPSVYSPRPHSPPPLTLTHDPTPHLPSLSHTRPHLPTSPLIHTTPLPTHSNLPFTAKPTLVLPTLLLPTHPFHPPPPHPLPHSTPFTPPPRPNPPASPRHTTFTPPASPRPTTFTPPPHTCLTPHPPTHPSCLTPPQPTPPPPHLLHPPPPNPPILPHPPPTHPSCLTPPHQSYLVGLPSFFHLVSSLQGTRLANTFSYFDKKRTGKRIKRADETSSKAEEWCMGSFSRMGQNGSGISVEEEESRAIRQGSLVKKRSMTGQMGKIM
ncbi:hypothetical protein Pcinc_013351 [Petrolisthes cinctipes]|uniref:Uncharacterized protein n=1 Tax=Petrolisthes cinctipes TaxID=88211 RepID=A0AAE1G2U1_PETCI|nr:hypothetical protein Pcinc_013351 [Petrolisthes cinctipes]